MYVSVCAFESLWCYSLVVQKCLHVKAPRLRQISPLTAFVLAVGSTSCVAVSIRRDTKKCHSFAPLLPRRRSGRKSYVQGLISTKQGGEEDRTDDGMGDGISPWNVCSE